MRRELVTSLAGLVDQFESKFVAVAFQQMEEERLRQQDGNLNCSQQRRQARQGSIGEWTEL